MGSLKPNGQRAQNAIILIWIVLAVGIVSLISSYFQYDLLQTVASGEEISTERATANDSREQIIGIIELTVYLISAVTFIQWFRRAYFNLHSKVNYLSYSESWAAGSWFIPIVNLYRPFQIMKELFHETKELLMKKGLIVKEKLTTTSLIMWWTFWIVSSLLGQFIFRYSMEAETVDDFTVSTVASMIANIITIPLALFTIKIIKDYSNVEHLLNELKDE